MERAIDAGVALLLSRDPAAADYPYTETVSSTWFKFGFPFSYWSNALELILSKQDAQGRWRLHNTLNGKMWADVERRGQPSKWVTLRVLRVLHQI